MKIKLSILFYLLGFSGYLIAQDSDDRRIIVSGFLSGEYTTLGYYGGLGIGIDYKNWAVTLSPVIDYSKAVSMFDGPWGIVTNLSYYPGLKHDRTINHFINAIHRIRFSNRFCSADNCEKKYNKTHEYLLGYGIQIRIYQKLYISNSINAGVFVEKLYSDYEKNWIKSKGLDVVIQLRLIYKFNE